MNYRCLIMGCKSELELRMNYYAGSIKKLIKYQREENTLKIIKQKDTTTKQTMKLSRLILVVLVGLSAAAKGKLFGMQMFSWLLQYLNQFSFIYYI